MRPTVFPPGKEDVTVGGGGTPTGPACSEFIEDRLALALASRYPWLIDINHHVTDASGIYPGDRHILYDPFANEGRPCCLSDHQASELVTKDMPIELHRVRNLKLERFPLEVRVTAYALFPNLCPSAGPDMTGVVITLVPNNLKLGVG